MRWLREGIVYGAAAALAGVAMAVLGGVGLGTPVTCHGRPMADGDTCFSIHRRTGPVVHDTAHKAAAQRRQDYALLIIGVPLAAGGAWWFRRDLRARRRTRSTGPASA